MRTPTEGDTVLDTTLPVWPFPLSVEYDPAQIGTVEEEGLSWAGRFGLIGEEETDHRLHHLRSAELVGYGYPRAESTVQTLIVQWAMWYFNLDDRFDDGAEGTSAERAAAATRPLRRLLESGGGAPGTLPDDTGDPVHASFADLLHRTAELMAPVQFRELTGHLYAYFDGLVSEAALRERRVLPDVDFYLALRRDTGPVLPLLDLVEQAESVRLPARFYGSPEYTEMIGAAADIASWINDVFSVSKELHRQDAYNLVILLHRTAPMTLEAASLDVVARMEQRLGMFRRALERVEVRHQAGEFTSTEEAAIRSWASGLLDFQHHGAWYLRHARYGRATTAKG